MLAGSVSSRSATYQSLQRRSRVQVQPMALLSGLFGGKAKKSTAPTRQQRKDEASAGT